MDAIATEAEELVETHLAWCEKIARARLRRLPARVDPDGVLSAALGGLWDAARRFDPGRGVSFQTFAGRRVSGAIADYVRLHTGSRNSARCQRFRRPLSLDTLLAQWDQNAGVEHTKAVELACPEPHRDRHADDLAELLLGGLDGQLKAVAEGYYLLGLRLSEVGAQLSVSASRASQLKTELLAVLRERLRARGWRVPEEDNANGH